MWEERMWVLRRIYRADLVLLLLQSQPAGSVWFCLVPGECSEAVSAVEHAVTEVCKVFVLVRSPLVSRGGGQVTLQRWENIRNMQRQKHSYNMKSAKIKNKRSKMICDKTITIKIKYTIIMTKQTYDNKIIKCTLQIHLYCYCVFSQWTEKHTEVWTSSPDYSHLSYV